MPEVQLLPEVLTLDQAAEYLRVTAEVVEREATRGALPGRRVESNWRFLRAALDQWLRGEETETSSIPVHLPAHPDDFSPDPSTGRLLRQAGRFHDDETLDDLRREAYLARGRPEVEPGPN